jgi:hypothetical protein
LDNFISGCIWGKFSQFSAILPMLSGQNSYFYQKLDGFKQVIIWCVFGNPAVDAAFLFIGQQDQQDKPGIPL